MSLKVLLPVLLCGALTQKAWSQGVPFTPGGGSNFSANPLYIGATFMKITPDSVKVWNRENSAGWTGTLYFVDPRTGALDSLFNNNNAARRCPTPAPCAASINLMAARPGFPNGHDIRVGDTVYFMYKVITGGNTADDRLPKFTGPNTDAAKRVGGAGGTLVYTTPAHNGVYAALPHAWSVAGRLNPTMVEFGFEDWVSTGSDFDFDDVIFGVSGLNLSLEKVATPIAVPGTSSFTSQVNVALSSATPGAVIHYTLDGSTPDSNSAVYTGPIAIIGNTTLKAIAYRAGMQKSDVMTETYTKLKTPPTLTILDQGGAPLPGPAPGYLTEVNSAYTVQVVTTQAGLDTLYPIATTLTAADQETLRLDSKVSTPDRITFTDATPFAIAATGQLNNGTTQAQSWDSLTVTWTNPKDPTEVASAKVLVRPAPKQAKIYFARDSLGTQPTDQFNGNEVKIYVVVEDGILPRDSIPKVILDTRSDVVGRGADHDTLVLIQVAPGKYVAAIPVNGSLPVPGDKTLQLVINDMITGTYTDPVDKDVAIANAGYGAAPEIDPYLQFTDSAGTVIADGAYWSPARGFLYLTYNDDIAAGAVKKKTVALTVVNNFGQGIADAESFDLDLDTTKTQGSKGAWLGKIALRDLPNVTPGNHFAETYIRGNVKAVVPTHDKNGAPTGANIQDTLLVAYPDQTPIISVTDPQGGIIIGRNTDSLVIRIHEQSLSSVKDTIYVDVTCSESGDRLGRVMLVEESPGVYVSKFIPKNEGVVGNLGDPTLTCRSSDIIKIVYVDPVYKTPGEISVRIDSPLSTRLYYTASASDTAQINSVSEGEATSFYAVVLAQSPRVAVVDTIPVVFRTDQGELDTLWAIETGPYTQKFMVQVPFAFVNSNPVPGNGILEGRITAQDANNRVIAHGSVTIGSVETRADIVLVAAYIKYVKAYIKDSNGDGAGDKVYIVFEKKLPKLPASIEAQWNTDDTTGAGASAFKKATGAKLSFLNADSMTVVADFTSTPFPGGATSIPAGEVPKGRLPMDPLFWAQKPPLEDSMGPVIVAAVKKPANIALLTPGDPSLNLDTLYITVSEPLKAGSATGFKDMLKFAASCSDYDNARTLIAYNDPKPGSDPTQFTVIIDIATSAMPLTKQCVFLNADPGKLADTLTNPAPKHGVPLGGEDRRPVVSLRGFPPVAGLDPNKPGFQVAVQDPRNQGGFAQQGKPGDPWTVPWIPPVGIQIDSKGKIIYPGVVGNINQPGSTTPENTIPSALPINISAIQVISSSPYIASVLIFDNLGNYVTDFKMDFGFHGEFANRNRQVPGGWVSYLPWDMMTKNGQRAGQGVYVWKVLFRFQNGKQELEYTRTGIMRPVN